MPAPPWASAHGAIVPRSRHDPHGRLASAPTNNGLRLAPNPSTRMIYLVGFAGGLAGSLHCIGMCGGFPLALARARATRATSLRQLLYNSGRLNTLMFIGAVCGGFGARRGGRARSRSSSACWRSSRGSLITLIGLEMLGLVRQVSARGAALHAADARALARWRDALVLDRRRTARARRVQRLPALPADLRLRRARRRDGVGARGRASDARLRRRDGAGDARSGHDARPGCARRCARGSRSVAGVLVVGFGILTLLRGCFPLRSPRALTPRMMQRPRRRVAPRSRLPPRATGVSGLHRDAEGDRQGRGEEELQARR